MLKSVSSGKLYVANAGDSRAVLCRLSRAYPMSYDFTPVTERQRLQTIGRLQPHLLGGYLVNSVSDPLFFFTDRDLDPTQKPKADPDLGRILTKIQSFEIS